MQIRLYPFQTRRHAKYGCTDEPDPVPSLLSALIFLVVGGLMVLSGVNFVRTSEAHPLYVASFDYRLGDKGKTIYRPVFQIERDGQAPMEYSGGFYTSWMSYDVGETVQGRVNDTNGVMRSTYALRIQFLIGTGFIIVGCFVSRYHLSEIGHRRRRGRNKHLYEVVYTDPP